MKIKFVKQLFSVLVVSAGLFAVAPQVQAAPEPGVEIEVNNTSGSDDDVVPLSGTTKWDTSTPGRIRLSSSWTKDMTIVLVNPPAGNGELNYRRLSLGSSTVNTAEDGSLTLALPKDGSWVPFTISGSRGSQGVGDALIEAHKDSSGGATKTTAHVSVYWLDNANIIVSVGGYYGLTAANYTVTTGNSHAVDYAAWATIKPSGLSGSAPQLANLRVGIMQNANSATHHRIWDTPVNFQWLTSASPLTVTTYEQLDLTSSIPGRFNDSEASVAPLYDQPGRSGMLDSRSLQIPYGISGGDTARSNDTPSPGFVPTWTHFIRSSGAVVAQVTYSNRVKATMNDSFETWAVFFNTTTNATTPIRQAHWNLNVDSLVTNPQTPQKAVITTPSGGTPVTLAPIESGPYAVAVINAPPNPSPSLSGAATPHSR